MVCNKVIYKMQLSVQVTRTYAHLGHTHAQHMVGEKLMHGHGVEMNQTEALSWFKLAAKAGHPHSSYNLAVAHLNGLNAELEVRK